MAADYKALLLQGVAPVSLAGPRRSSRKTKIYQVGADRGSLCHKRIV